MNQNKQPEALRLADIYAKKGLFAVEDELRRLHAESELHMQELRSYRITVENREARIVELERMLAAAPQPTACNPSMQPLTELATKVAPVQMPEPIETIRYWRDAYANPKGDEHFMGHGMVVKIFDDYLALLAQHGIN